MATAADLKDALKQSLETNGALDGIRARVRAEVYLALNDESERPPQLSRENLLINELIREYLEYNKYKYTASVFAPETGLSGPPLERAFLADELNLHDEGNAAKVPLLYGILGQMLRTPKQT
eukprot:m.129300 g.129300  ORF g.129300 m.129300 type:complete len:122 (-) comp17458_c0_seq6:1100-1465(-)